MLFKSSVILFKMVSSFVVDLKKQSTCVVQLTNTTNLFVAFKVLIHILLFFWLNVSLDKTHKLAVVLVY